MIAANCDQAEVDRQVNFICKKLNLTILVSYQMFDFSGKEIKNLIELDQREINDISVQFENDLYFFVLYWASASEGGSRGSNMDSIHVYSQEGTREDGSFILKFKSTLSELLNFTRKHLEIVSVTDILTYFYMALETVLKEMLPLKEINSIEEVLADFDSVNFEGL